MSPTSPDPEVYVATGERAWRWVLDQVRWDEDGPWIPETVPLDGPPPDTAPELRHGLHSGTGGLAHVLAEVRLARPWTDEEERLAAGIATQLRAAVPTTDEASYFDGLVSSLGALVALGEQGPGSGPDLVVDRLLATMTPDGWPQPWAGEPRYSPEARINDVTLGTAGVLLGAVWAQRHGVPRAGELATRTADLLLAEAEETPDGLRWLFVPRRFRDTPPTEMPGWSHGQAGVVAALAVAGGALDRPDLVAGAHSGGERLLAIGERTPEGGFVQPRYLPALDTGEEPISWGWCHGAAGTSQAFAALDSAGVPDVGGEPPAAWRHRGLAAVRASGVPERVRPGFWDNDGRCCGTAGVGDVVLDAWQRDRADEDLGFAVVLADALVARARGGGPHVWWQFVEHRAEQPLLPPGVGWMQGAAGIAAYLLRLGRLLEQGPDAEAAARLDTWWALEPVRRG